MRNYTIVGAGAIGGTIAFHLASAGHEITVVDADTAHAERVRASGITILRGTQRHAVRVHSVLSPMDGSCGCNDDITLSRVILAVKSQATDRALDWIAPRLAADGFVVSMQNGLNESAIVHRVGAARTIGAFVNLFADVVAPGEIRDGGPGALVVGELDGARSERVDEIVHDLQAWGPAKATTNVAGYLWAKLAFGAMLTATALADASMADLIDRHRDVMHALAREVLAVAAAESIPPERFDAFDPLPYTQSDRATHAATDQLVAWLRTQPKTRSGIWMDLAVRHRPTEVPWQYRPVLSIAERHGLPTPSIAALLQQIAQLEQGADMDETRIDALLGGPR